MKKALSILLSMLMLLSLFSFGAVVSSAEETVLIDSGDEWAYYAAFDEATLPEGWYNVGFDTSAWTKGASPFTGDAYSNSSANTRIEQGDSSVVAAFVKTFEVSNVDGIEAMSMKLFYDQDPVVYINGVEVWSATGWNNGLSTFVMDEHIDALVDGTNTIAVYMHNPAGGGGFHMDMVLSAGVPDAVNSDGTISVKEVTKTGFIDFGGVNAATNILDGNVDSCSGSARNADVEQSFTLTFWEELDVKQIYLQCKGTEDGVSTSHEDGTTFGYYNVYVGEELVAENAPAVSKSDGGHTITLEETVKASTVKVELVGEWYSTNWANLADIVIWNNVDNIVIEPTDITLNKYNIELKVGETEQLTVIVNPEGATVEGFVWTSYQEDIVTVDDNGLLTAVAEGDAMIMVESADGVFNAMATVVVTAADVNDDTTGDDTETPGADTETPGNTDNNATENQPTENNTNETENNETDDGSEGGGMTVVIVCAGVGVVILAAVILFVLKKKK